MPEADESNLRQRKPANTAFKQQRLKAWQPILTPRTVLPAFFLLGLLFVPLGVGLYITSNSVQELQFDYTECEQQAPTVFSAPVPPRSPITEWKWTPASRLCTVRFQVQTTMVAPVFLYYRLTNFYQNHRRYVKSLDADQLLGAAVSGSSLDSSCYPLSQSDNGLVYYPCGLIADSQFNDTIGVQSSDFTAFQMAGNQSTGAVASYQFSEQGISWASDAQKYGQTKYDLSKITPPRDWTTRTYRGVKLSGGSWASIQNSTMLFNPSQDEHFQVWMRIAGLPTFRKLYGRNTQDSLLAGIYELQIQSNFPVTSYSGTKSVVITTTSWLGGKNPFLGIAYMTVGCICLVLGTLFLLKHLISPRKLGDHTYLSWNQNATSGGGGTQSHVASPANYEAPKSQ